MISVNIIYKDAEVTHTPIHQADEIFLTPRNGTTILDPLPDIRGSCGARSPETPVVGQCDC
jgi:hypothetical protein